MSAAQQAAPAPTRAQKWQRYLADMRSFSGDTVRLETQGLLVRVNGLVLEAAGLHVPVGSVCEIRMDGQSPVIAEVVGFSGDRAYLMPTGDVAGHWQQDLKGAQKLEFTFKTNVAQAPTSMNCLWATL